MGCKPTPELYFDHLVLSGDISGPFTTHHRLCLSSCSVWFLLLNKHGHMRTLQHTYTPHSSHSCSCHTRSSAIKQKERLETTTVQYRKVKGLAERLTSLKGSGLISEWQGENNPLGSLSMLHQWRAYFSARQKDNISHSNVLITVTAEASNKFDLPLSRLRLQGFSKLLLTSGQPACVFQLLTKPAAVASGTPLSLRKSSAWFLLKFPHRPGGIKDHVQLRVCECGAASSVFTSPSCRCLWYHTSKVSQPAQWCAKLSVLSGCMNLLRNPLLGWCNPKSRKVCMLK